MLLLLRLTVKLLARRSHHVARDANALLDRELTGP